MQRNKDSHHIDPRKGLEHGNLKKELISFFIPSEDKAPFVVHAYGITNPDADYYIKRVRAECFILEYIVQGKGTVINNGNTFNVSSGDCYFLQPSSCHKYFPDKSCPFRKYWINFSGAFIFDVISAFGINTQTVFYGVDLNNDFSELFTLEKTSCKNDEIYHSAAAIVFRMLMKMSKSIQRKMAPSPLAYAIKIKLDKSLVVDFKLQDISDEFFVSVSKAMREFKKHYGTTPYAYLLDARLEMAKKMLTESNITVKSLADNFCFNDEHHFSRAFKKVYGISPKHYRDNLTDDE